MLSILLHPTMHTYSYCIIAFKCSPFFSRSLFFIFLCLFVEDFLEHHCTAHPDTLNHHVMPKTVQAAGQRTENLQQCYERQAGSQIYFWL